MSARSPLICSAVELWYKKMLKIGSLSELTGIDTKIKVAGFQRLYSKWLWLLMAVYKPLFADAAYLHHWLSVTVHFNRYNLCFDKYTECGDKCKSVYFIALHICVVPLSFSLFCECPLSDTRCWMIGHFRRYVTEHLLNTKVVVFLEFLWFAVCFLFSRRCWMIESVIKPENFCKVYVWFAWKSVEQCAMGDIRWEKCNKVELFA